MHYVLMCAQRSKCKGSKWCEPHLEDLGEMTKAKATKELRFYQEADKEDNANTLYKFFQRTRLAKVVVVAPVW